MKFLYNWLFSIIKRFNILHYKTKPKNWKQDLVSLYLIRKRDGICFFSHHFQLGVSQIESQLVGLGFVAISNMMKETIDTLSCLKLIDLGRKKVLVEERKNILALLVVTRYYSFFLEKLGNLVNHFERIFGLQLQINNITKIQSEDYALTKELVSVFFEDNSTRSANVLKLIPPIFKSIQQQGSIIKDEIKIPLAKSNSLIITREKAN